MLNNFRLTFSDAISNQSCNHFKNRVATMLERPDFGSLTVLFSSEGGSTDQSISLYNFIRQLPVSISIHAVGHVGSAANIVYLAADQRTAAPHSRFFFHEYDWGFDGRQTLHRINEAVERLRSDMDLACKVIESRTQLPAELMRAVRGETGPLVLEPGEAVRRGLAQRVCDLPQAGPDYLVAVWT